jgi:hypothetical protein
MLNDDVMQLYKDFLTQRLPKGIAGLKVPGNIDLTKQPIVNNPDGTTSTVSSMSFGRGGNEVLIPQVAHDGSRVLEPRDAIEQYNKSDKHLGIFTSPETATDYAIGLHNDYEQGRIPGYPKVTSPANYKMNPLDLLRTLFSLMR